MDDISELLAGILNDPESMERVRKMAEDFLGSGSEEAPEPKASSPLGDIAGMLGAEDLGTIVSIITKLKSAQNDNRTQLLTALKPHLSEPRREKVDTAIKILKVLEILPLIKESGFLKL
ncbi:MAG: hypothetical protein IKD04_07590 [Clostridia bacterium]|nr:hypothetical protein [Clostridia bacterium]